MKRSPFIRRYFALSLFLSFTLIGCASAAGGSLFGITTALLVTFTIAACTADDTTITDVTSDVSSAGDTNTLTSPPDT
ncbi:MAG: hypothetical protein VX223_18035, partial [Myxococcota bacterium]|nr:hypothetical protein [Myxococcota bacterium]